MLSKIRFILWFSFLATIGVFAFLALISMTPVQSGPGALTALANIPNHFVLVLCGVLVALGIWLRPKPLEPSFALVAGTVLGYVVLLIAFFSVPELRGYYKLKVQVLDWNHQPVKNVVVHTYYSASLFVPRSEKNLATDSNGFVTDYFNKYSEVSGTINYPSSSERLSDFRVASFRISRQLKSETFQVITDWSNKRYRDGENTHYHTTKNVNVLGKTLVVFLPSVNGDDSDPYGTEQK